MSTTRTNNGAPSAPRRAPLFESSEWDFMTMKRTYDAIAAVALDDLGLDIYTNQMEVISSEQMLDAYASIGLPLMYKHWSFGKRFIHDETRYRKGYQGLAYEIVINSNPCISYLMEQNTMAVQALVMAHAAFGHNHFFKNNYLFQQWTDAGDILDFLDFAKKTIEKYEEKYGKDAVEKIITAAHALKSHGVFRSRKKKHLTKEEEEERRMEALQYLYRTYDDVYGTTVPGEKERFAKERDHITDDSEAAEAIKALKLPEENILYFLEHHARKLEPWQRDVLRIVRTLEQYFYPQKQTKLMNEGCACFVHYYIMNALYDEGLLTEGAMLEFMHNHSNVVFQPAFDDRRYAGINPYALGFDMMNEIKRIVTGEELDKQTGDIVSCTDEQRAEDREWFPDIAGTGDWRTVLKDVWANYRDESFILQFLSPNLIRKWRLFSLVDDTGKPHFLIGAIHNKKGYRQVRKDLAALYDLSRWEPHIEITDAKMLESRELILEHTAYDGIPLEEQRNERQKTALYLQQLWGYKVSLFSRWNGRQLTWLKVDEDGTVSSKEVPTKPADKKDVASVI